MTRALAIVAFAGGALKLAWLSLPHGPDVNEVGVVAMALGAWSVGALLLAAPPRLVSDRLLNVVVAVLTVEVSVALYFAHDERSDFAFFYVWVIPYAFVFFSPRAAVLQTLWAAACLAVALAATPHMGAEGLEWDGDDTARWVVVAGTLAIVGLVVGRIVEWLRESQALLRQGFEASPLGMSLANAQLRYLDVNEAYAQMLGRPREDVIGRRYEEVTDPRDVDVVRREAELALAEDDGARAVLEKRLLRPDGRRVPVVCHTTVVRDRAGSGRYLFTQVEDVTERERHAQEAARHAAQHEALAHLGEVALREEELGDLIGEVVRTVTAALDVDLCVVVELSPEGEELVADFGGREGLAGRQPVIREPWGLTALTLRERRPIVVEDLGSETRFTPSPLLVERGAVCGISARVGSYEDPVGILGAFTTERRRFTGEDVTLLQAVANVLADAIQRHRSEEATRHAALHDPLTGLPNRALVLDRIEHALGLLRREAATVAVLVLDLDRFKVINDSLGHAAGDQVLLTMAPRLRDAVRPEDTVGRLGGDEFTVVCERLSGAHDAVATAERVAAAIHRPVVIDGGEHFLSGSIGIAVTSAPDETPESLLRDADAAMYRAKKHGRGRYEIFDEQMRAQVLGRLRTETELRRAIHAGDLRVHYQPIVDVDTRRPVSVEALVRWQHDGGLLEPDAFIPVAEETGLIRDVGLWVLEHACAQVGAWQRELGLPLHLAVNVSGRQMADPALPATIAQIADQSGLAPGTLALEVTESVVIRDLSTPAAAFAGMREHGLRLQLDDFGTGYSSLTRLKRLPLDALKVDRSFISGLGSDADDSAIVEAVIGLAGSLGLDAVAEGVETEEQLALLRDLECRKAQGYLFSRPLPAEEVPELLVA